MAVHHQLCNSVEEARRADVANFITIIHYIYRGQVLKRFLYQIARILTHSVT